MLNSAQEILPLRNSCQMEKYQADTRVAANNYMTKFRTKKNRLEQAVLSSEKTYFEALTM